MSLKKMGPKWSACGYKNAEVDISCKIREVIQILDSSNTTFHVKTKTTSILIDNCTRCQIILEENVVGTIELNKVKRSTIRVVKDAPLFDIANSSGSHLWMTHENANKVKLYLTGSDSMNLHYLNSDDEEVEVALPEQILTILGEELDPTHYAVVAGQDPIDLIEENKASVSKSTTTTTTTSTSKSKPPSKAPVPGKQRRRESEKKMASKTSKSKGGDIDWSDEKLKGAVKELQKSKKSTNWVLFGLNDTKVDFIGKGKGGLKELKSSISETKNKTRIVFGSFLVHGEDRLDSGTCIRDKFVYFSFIGSGVQEYERASFNFTKKKLPKFFGSVALTLDLRSMDLFTEKEIGVKLINAGAAHKPTHYDFGGGNIIPITSLVDGDDEESDEDFD